MPEVWPVVCVPFWAVNEKKKEISRSFLTRPTCWAGGWPRTWRLCVKETGSTDPNTAARRNPIAESIPEREKGRRQQRPADNACPMNQIWTEDEHREALTRFGWTTSKGHRFGRNEVPTPVQQLNFIERRIDERSGAPSVAGKDNTILKIRSILGTLAD
jgi:hypothetical protein